MSNKKTIRLFFLFWVWILSPESSLNAQALPLTVCFRFIFSGTPPVQVRLTVPGRSHLLLPADTCLRVSLDATGRGEAVVEAEGYHTQRLRFWADTLPPGRYLTLRLAGAVTQLGEVVVRPDERLRQRGDTLIIATDSLRTRPHARATELLDQLPGASLSPDGTLRVLGKTVEEVTVDGKALFGGNAAATLDALQAEMIKQLELAPTGRGNANRATMNITLKDDRKNGTYGEAGGSPGTNQRQQAALRLNRIAPGRFENGFLAADNTNQRLLSPSDETRFQRNLLDRELRGAYSVMDVAETHLFNRPNDRPDAVPDLGERRGINRARNGGLNVTRSSGKTEWAGYVLADQNTQHLSQQLNRIRLLPPLQQLDTSRLDQTLQRARLWAGLSAMWRFGPRITLKTAQSLMLGREGLELANQQRFYFGEAREPPLVSGLNRNEQQQTQHRATLWQQALLTLRHRRPAQITSLYLGHEAGRTRTDRRYLNDVPFGLSRPLFNHHTLDRLDRSYSLGFQGLHSLPLSRRWLLEGRVGVQRQGFLADQTGGQLNAVGGYRFRPDLSLGGFRVADWQTDARMGVFYRQDKLSLLGSLGLWRWSSQRGLFGMYRATALLPRLYAEYRPSVRGAFTLSYQRRPERPGPNQLWPLPDSTDAQRLSVGNAGLLPFFTNAYEAGARLLLGNGQNVTLSLQVDHTPNPIIPVNRADSLGLPTLGLAQRGGIQRLAFTVVWLEFSRSKPVQWHVLAQVGRQESLVGFNDQLRRFNNTYAFAAFSLRWNPSSRTSWKADVNQTFLGQASSAANRLNYRLEATLNLESEVRKRGYLSLRLRHTRNLNTQQRPVEFTLIDASLRSYFLEDNRLSVELGLQNALDVTRLYEYRSDTFQQQEQFTNRLPRFGSIGLTYYFSRWRSGKR